MAPSSARQPGASASSPTWGCPRRRILALTGTEEIIGRLLAGLGTSLRRFYFRPVATFLGIIVGFTTGYKGARLDTGLTLITNTACHPGLPVLVDPRHIMPASVFYPWPSSWPCLAGRPPHHPRPDRRHEAQRATWSAKVSGGKVIKDLFTELLPNLIPYLFMGFASARWGAWWARWAWK
jgi:peptide/nickel transport system permease protein